MDNYQANFFARDSSISEARKNAAFEIVKTGQLALKEGRYDLGWPPYETRFDWFGHRKILPQPLWRGEPLDGKSILVFGEQGVGDEVLFASCYPDLIATGARCHFVCEERLQGLFERSFSGAAIYCCGYEPERWSNMDVDYQIPAGSVLQYFRSHITEFPPSRGYLHAVLDRIRHWRARFDQLGSGPKIGISWQGGVADELRRAPGEFWIGLFKLEGVHYINLQYDADRNHLDRIRAQSGVEVHTWDDIDLKNDLGEIAAQMAALDLVITVPNTVTHMAGAMGTPVWILFTASWGAWWILNGGVTP